MSRSSLHPLRPAALSLLCATAGAVTTSATTGVRRQVEPLDRGTVAIALNSSTADVNAGANASASGVFVSWRLLATDAPGVTFNLYRDGKKLNPAPLAVSNFTDTGGTPGARYAVRTMLDGKEGPQADAGAVWRQPFLAVPLDKPQDGVTPDGQPYTYEVNDGSAADLDGDGQYELLVKWQPSNAHDNAHAGFTGNTYLYAYRLEGRRPLHHLSRL